jgi:hypothetical protein
LFVSDLLHHVTQTVSLRLAFFSLTQWVIGPDDID